MLLLAGCLGLGGGGGGTLKPEDVERVRSDPRIDTMRSIFERADTLLIPGVHLEVSSSIRGRSRSDEFALRGQCSGTECVVRDDDVRITITLDDLMIDDLVRPTEVSLTKADLGKRDGFDTLVVEGRDQISEQISDDVITAAGSATSYGVWSKHGFAAVELSAGSLEQSLISGRMNGVLAYVIGRRNATNPAGVRGGAIWQGPVEAASTRTFARHQGKATLTIPDLGPAQDRRRDRGGRQRHQRARLEGHAAGAGKLHVGDRGAGLPGRQLPRPEARGGVRRLRHRRLCGGVRGDAAVGGRDFSPRKEALFRALERRSGGSCSSQDCL